MAQFTKKLSMSKILLLAICILFIFQKADAKQSGERRRKDKAGTSERPQVAKLCDSPDREQKVHCYCGAMALTNISQAECWVFKGALPIDDPIWDAFQFQNRLEELIFTIRSDGALNFVPTRALRYLRKLKKLNIKYGNINDVYPFAFANLSSLTEIKLSMNKIVTLEQNAFAHLSNLTTLSLEENRIVEIGMNCFIDLPVLTVLNIANNNVTVIQDGAFKQLVQLLELDLNKNSIVTLNKHTFDGLANLKVLHLKQNRMKMLGDLTFSELWNLQELNLDKNELKFISERAFDGLSQLKKLSLRDNRLTALTGGLLEGVRWLLFLDMSHNRLQTLTLDDIRPILDNLKNVSSLLLLDDNSFTCDCRLTWMHALRNDTKNEKTKESLEQIICFVEPSQLHLDHALIKQKAIEGSSVDHNVGNQLQDKDYSRTTTHKIVSQKTTYEYVDEATFKGDLENEMFDDAQKDTSDSANHNQTRIGIQKRLFQIPVEMLPCPEELKDSTEAPLLRPSRGEVKDFRGVSSSSTGCRFDSNKVIFVLSMSYGIVRFKSVFN